MAIQQLLRPGQMVTGETSRASCRIERFLGGGGQGEVYQATLGGKPVAVKWYFPRTATSEQRATLEDLVRQKAPNERFLWPQEMVSDGKSVGFGYVMGLRQARYRGIIDLMKRRVSPSLHMLATACYQLTDSYYQLHAAGLCYRDISFGNVFFDPNTGDVLICDNDNVAINNVPTGGVLGTPRFMAPEVVRREALPSRDTDLYSLAVLLFYLLMIQHPLDGKRELAIKCLDLPALEKLYGFDPLFIFDPQDESNRPDPTVHRNALAFWPIYPQSLKELFTRSFTSGLHDPRHGRVKETEWRTALIQLRDAIFPCPNCNAENFYDDSAEISIQRECWACKQTLHTPLRLLLDGKRFVALNHNTQLYSHHLDRNGSYRFTPVLAEVSRHPHEPNVWGLKNLSSDKWTVIRPDGAMNDVPPGRTVRLDRGVNLQFGAVNGEVA